MSSDKQAQANRESDRSPRPSWQRYERVRVWGVVAWSFTGLLVLSLASLWLLGTLADFLIPAIVGTVLAILLNPATNWMERYRIPRAVGAMLAALLLPSVVVVLVWSIGGALIDRIPDLLDAGYDGIVELCTMLNVDSVGPKAVESARQAEEAAADFLVSGVLPFVGEGLLGGIGAVLAFFTMVLFSYFLMWDAPLVRAWVERSSGLSPTGARALTATTIRTIRRYILGMTITAAVNFLIVSPVAALWGVSLWLAIGVVVFLGTYIPYLGGIFAGVLAFLVALGTEGLDAGLAVGVAVLLVNFLVQPNVQVFAVGAVLRERPLAVFSLSVLGILVAGAFGGAAAAPLARVVMDAADIVRSDRGTGKGPSEEGSSTDFQQAT